MHKTILRATISVFILFLFLVPLFIQSPYMLHLTIMALMTSAMCESLLLLFRVGRPSFCHAGFLGIGAYSSALLTINLGMNYWIALPLSGVAAMAIAFPFGLVTLRVRGTYFWLATFAFGEAIVRLCSMLEPLGGVRGIRDIPFPNAITIPYIYQIDFGSTRIPYYYLILFLALFIIFFIAVLDRSWVGHLLRSIGEDNILSQSIGINMVKYSVAVFMLGCFFAGLIGSFYAHYLHYIHPGINSAMNSAFYIVAIVIGGTTLAGPIVGGVLIALAPEILRGLPGVEGILFGLMLIIIIIFMPEGLADSFLKKLRPLSN